MKFPVVILAGGEGSRIGGGKPLKLLAGQRFIDRAKVLGRQWSDIVVVAVRNAEQGADFSLKCILDEGSIEGPLAGLVAALRFGLDTDSAAVLTIAADMPFLPANLGPRLAAELGNAQAALASSGGNLHPVCGLWRLTAFEDLAAYLATGRRSLRGFAESIGFNPVAWPDQPQDPFFNINSTEDLARAERLLTD